jgi:hypothetical protein
MPPDVAGIALRAAVATLSAVSVVAFALLVWQIADILLLVFAAVLLALLLRRLADWIARSTGTSIAVGLGTAIGLILLAAIGSLWLFGAEIAGQFDRLTQMVPEAWARTRGLLEEHRWGLALVRLIEDFEHRLSSAACCAMSGAPRWPWPASLPTWCSRWSVGCIWPWSRACTVGVCSACCRDRGEPGRRRCWTIAAPPFANG